NFAHEVSKSVVLHGSADSLAHIPSCPVVTATDLAVNLKRADSLLALSHQVNDLEPSAQRIVGIVENSSSNDREAIAVLATAIFILTNPMKGTFFQFVYLLAVAAWTAYALRPAQLLQVLLASLFAGEACFEFRQGDAGFRSKD